MACSQPPLRSVSGSTVQTDSGSVSGVARDDLSVHWRDIPYAKAPVGERRWRAPQPLIAPEATIEPLDNVMCVQMAGEISGTHGDAAVGTEDCLYLDIVAPANAGDRALPVMFWIHGGGNTSGTKGTYDFSALAASQQVVIVTVNYRLGPLGWLTHPSLQEQATGLDRSSNFGQLDLIAALRWVQRNIAAFGGDTGNVTIFGESAGAHNVYALLVSPLADGLFHRAIAQSGYTTTVSPRQAVNRDREFPQLDRGSWELFTAMGLNAEAISGRDLRALPAYDILHTYQALDKDHVAPLTTADGIVIPEAGMAAALGDPRYAKSVPVLAGSNRDEVTLWLGLNRYFVDGDPVLFGLLPPRMSIKEPAKYRYWVDLRSRGWKARGVDSPMLSLQAAGYDALYVYRFDWDEQDENWFLSFPDILGAAHGSEIAFIMGAPMFGSVGDYMYPATESARRMTELMMTAWGNFARDGLPGSVANQAWPPFVSSAPHTLVLDSPEAIEVVIASPSLDGLLQEIAAPSALNATERCILVWEMVTNIANPAYGDYARWNDGECADFDARLAKQQITTALEAEFGSATLP